MFQDYLFFGTDVRVQYAFRMLHLSHLAQYAQVIHKLSTNRALLLADVLLGAALLSSILEEEERINVRIQAGEHFTVAAEVTKHASSLRGYAEFNPESALIKELDQLSPHQEWSEPLPIVVRTLRSLPGKQQLFEGRTQSLCRGLSLEAAFTEHLQQSYQMFTHLKLSSWIDSRLGLRAFGALFQELPDGDNEPLTELRQHVNGLPPLVDWLSESEDADEWAKKLIPHAVHPVKSVNPVWGCSCSQESIEATIGRLSAQDLADLISEKKPAEVTCHYCSKVFLVGLKKMNQLLTSRLASQSARSTTH